MFVDYRIFLSFRFHWALLACLRWSLGTLGLSWVPVDGHWGSICYLWGSIGAPLGRHWAPFVAFGGPLGRRWGSLGATLGVTLRSLWEHFFTFGHFEHFYRFGDFLRKSVPWSVPSVRKAQYLYVQIEDSKRQFFFSQTRHRFRVHIYWTKCTSQIFVHQTVETQTQVLRYQIVPPKSIFK